MVSQFLLRLKDHFGLRYGTISLIQINENQYQPINDNLTYVHQVQLIFPPSFQSLAESLHQQEETLMEELHSSADSLIKTCKPEVSTEVESSVKETVQAWDEKTVQLEDLCKRYQQAVELWSRYKQASDAIANWSDELLHSVNDLPPEEALKVN